MDEPFRSVDGLHFLGCWWQSLPTTLDRPSLTSVKLVSIVARTRHDHFLSFHVDRW